MLNLQKRNYSTIFENGITSLINQGEFIPSAWVNRSCIFNRPFECVVECYFNGVTHSGFERTETFFLFGFNCVLLRIFFTPNCQVKFNLLEFFKVNYAPSPKEYDKWLNEILALCEYCLFPRLNKYLRCYFLLFFHLFAQKTR